MNQQEFRQTFEQYFDAIRNYVYFMSSDVDLAEDIAQDTFVKLWDNRDTIILSTVKSYLYTIARNLTLNHIKRDKLKYNFIAQTELRQDNNSPEFELEQKEFKEKLEAVIASIPEGNREVFLMNRIEGMKYAEIAERLGLSVKAVEKRMSKALKIIREEIEFKI
ncbi:MAG: RNA polymerase sigma-70 factor [Bacteroidota bacterium]